MQKIKSLNLGVVSLLKAVLIGIVCTLIGIVIFAFVLKFTDLNSNIIGYVNDAIKAISIFVIVFLLNRKHNGNLLIKSVVAGFLYALLTFIIFSILNGGFNFNMSIVFDILFAIIVSAIAAIIINLTGKRAN